MHLSIRPATAADQVDIAALCWGYRDLLVERMAHVPEMLERYYAKDAYADLLADLPRLHARPMGEILIAEDQQRPIGCAMYLPAGPETCEIKRIFVAPEGRGYGAASALISEAMVRAKTDGYKRMVLDTVHTLTEAIGLYEKIGFQPGAPFYTPDPAFVHTLRFYEISLYCVQP